MKKLGVALLLSGSFLLAQDTNSGDANQRNSKARKGEITIQGASGDLAAITC